MTDLLKAVELGIVEGLTEFLPISSTGHLRIVEGWLGVSETDPYWKMFTIVIQIGAIFAVVLYFWSRILGLLKKKPEPGQAHPLGLVAVGTIPVLVVGFLTHKWVEEHLEHALPIALALIIGGAIMWAVEWARPRPTTLLFEQTTWKQGLWVGCCQVLAAVFPGASRSASTIIGGMAGGMSRPAAAEFSFFLAIPAMSAACGYSLLKHLKEHPIASDQLLVLAVGTAVSFITAWVVIRLFMNYVRRQSFIPFAIYRILFGGWVLYAALHHG